MKVQAKRGKVHFFVTLFAQVALVLNMSFVGVFFVSHSNYAHAQSGQEMGRIEIKKLARNAGDQRFYFQADFGDFELANGDWLSFDLLPGNYSVKELSPQGWRLGSASCRGERDDGTVIDLVNERLDIDLDAGESIVCVLRNVFDDGEPEPEEGSISVKKLIDQDGEIETVDDRFLATSTTWTFSLFDGSSTTTQDTVNGVAVFDALPAGTYTISEQKKNGFLLLIPFDNSIDVNLAEAENKTVEFVNTPGPEPLLGSITVRKFSDADGLASTTDDRVLVTNDWTFELSDGSSTLSQVTVNGETVFSGLLAGDYTITETLLSGWQFVDPFNGVATTSLSEGEDKTIDFVNFEEEQTSITVRKFSDADGLASTTDDRVLVTNEWTFELNDGSSTLSQVTVNGQTVFSGLSGGNYTITETLLSGWQFVDPSNGVATTSLASGENITIDFVNFKEETPPNGGGGGGGFSSSGGGGGGIIFQIFDEKAINPACDAITITWRTNLAANSRVVYDTVSRDISGVTSANLGYAFSTPLNETEVTFHEVLASGLNLGTTYFFRPISIDGGIKKIGQEISLSTLPAGQCVLGEAGEPILNIEKTVAVEYASPGEQDIEYKVIVSNSGNLTAFNVIVTDILPEGLEFSDQEGNTKERNIGDLKPDESRQLTFLVDVLPNVKDSPLINTSEARADNHGPVTDTADLAIREAKVLAGAGFEIKEFFMLLLLTSSILAGSVYVRRKFAVL